MYIIGAQTQYENEAMTDRWEGREKIRKEFMKETRGSLKV
jgi:hypothetical protein